MSGDYTKNTQGARCHASINRAHGKLTGVNNVLLQ